MVASDVPAGLQARGARLWGMFLAQDDGLTVDTDPRREVALEACRVADRLERLNEICDRVEPIIETDKGALTHPAFPEARQQANVLKQLVAALRLPDEATGKRPQRRGPRGAQRPSVVSSLDRARAKSGA
ncbi:hypothetical protein [Rhodococcoides fascians]|uniref:hypothetical protein n=1 Tax=Rhodococcoides fascians TaxID=1828 RepID=UPI0012D2E901|nr:hypothetical protein [Rhodococcus fascians]